MRACLEFYLVMSLKSTGTGFTKWTSSYTKQFTDALGSNTADPFVKLLPMRNLLAHNGRLSNTAASRLLQAHTMGFERLVAGLDFLTSESGVALIASPSGGTVRLLRGPAWHGEEFDPAKLPEGFRQVEPGLAPTGHTEGCIRSAPTTRLWRSLPHGQRPTPGAGRGSLTPLRTHGRARRDRIHDVGERRVEFTRSTNVGAAICQRLST